MHKHNFKDITGCKFARLSVISLNENRSSSGSARWDCICDCGNSVVADGLALRSGAKKSCGCLHLEQAQNVNFKHGLYKHRLYQCWSAMIGRCFNEDDANYENYGGRGITVCKEWLDVKNFVDSDFAKSFQEGLTIDRINNNGNYEPINCRWVTKAENNRNKRHRRPASEITKKRQSESMKKYYAAKHSVV